MHRLLALVLACCVCQGCFALDEIDKGQKELKRYSPRVREAERAKAEQAKERPSARDGEAEDGWLARATQLAGGVKQWWETRGEKTPERDPDDVPVPCEIGSHMQFMRKSDCLLRGGRASG